MESAKQMVLESGISDFIKKDNGCSTHFEYNKVGNSLRSIRVTTFNPKKNESFLLIEVPCIEPEVGLISIFDWIKTHNISAEDVSHTILWTKRGEGKTYKSYFYATNARKALDKFFYDKNEDEYIIYEVKINPIS